MLTPEKYATVTSLEKDSIHKFIDNAPSAEVRQYLKYEKRKMFIEYAQKRLLMNAGVYEHRNACSHAVTQARKHQTTLSDEAKKVGVQVSTIRKYIEALGIKNPDEGFLYYAKGTLLSEIGFTMDNVKLPKFVWKPTDQFFIDYELRHR